MTEIKTKTLAALSINGPQPAPERLAGFYDIDGNYAGASFAQLQPLDPDDITVADLHAVSLMSVAVGPGATRRLLQGSDRNVILDSLREIPQIDISTARATDLTAMADLYGHIKKALANRDVRNPNCWVTASKICARKRPNLFPVRDSVIRNYLGLTKYADYRVDWLIFRCLMRDSTITSAIDAMAATALAYGASNNTKLHLDYSRLRLLDAALWTFARPKRVRPRKRP